jgi:hypothetical protein
VILHVEWLGLNNQSYWIHFLVQWLFFLCYLTYVTSCILLSLIIFVHIFFLTKVINFLRAWYSSISSPQAQCCFVHSRYSVFVYCYSSLLKSLNNHQYVIWELTYNDSSLIGFFLIHNTASVVQVFVQRIKFLPNSLLSKQNFLEWFLDEDSGGQWLQAVFITLCNSVFFISELRIICPTDLIVVFDLLRLSWKSSENQPCASVGSIVTNDLLIKCECSKTSFKF